MYNIFGQDAYHAIAEIAILWAIFYVILKAAHGSRAIQVIGFLFLLFVISYLCQILSEYRPLVNHHISASDFRSAGDSVRS